MVSSRRTWWIPIGSFVIAVMLSFTGGSVPRALARLAADPTGVDLCHVPTAENGENDVGGENNGVPITSTSQGFAGELGFTSLLRWWYRRPVGEVRIFGGANNGGRDISMLKKDNTSKRGWTLIHGNTGETCCHPVKMNTSIQLATRAKITKPTVAGWNVIALTAHGSIDQTADNCGKGKPGNVNALRIIGLVAWRRLDRNGVYDESASVTDNTRPGGGRRGFPVPFNAAGEVEYNVTLEAKQESWEFRKDTEMVWKGGATLLHLESAPGATSSVEGVAHTFKSPSQYSVSDNGNENKCSN